MNHFDAKNKLGTYSLEGMTSCKECPAGYFCVYPNISASVCPVGKYSGSGATVCSPCSLGYMCPVSDLFAIYQLIKLICRLDLQHQHLLVQNVN